MITVIPIWAVLRAKTARGAWIKLGLRIRTARCLLLESVGLEGPLSL